MELSESITRLKALINTSLHYSSDSYDIERFMDMRKILEELIETYSNETSEKEIALYFDSDVGYVTPKVDIRSVVFNNEDKLLLVKEKKEETWSLPGGWADVGYSPSEIAKKETLEESGLNVTVMNLFKVVDKAKHPYPKSLEYVYKLFFYCVADSFDTKTGLETSEVNFFSEAELMSLGNISIDRNTLEDLLDAFSFHKNSWEGTKFD
ncbi:MAG: NUDIX hydrolase N-terminal domain-containing protein [Streptococcaceae bacterium]|nr:NUDIX hydrolase N-terminal domain-containing protein [Streptococcaceae bacterium]